MTSGPGFPETSPHQGSLVVPRRYVIVRNWKQKVNILGVLLLLIQKLFFLVMRDKMLNDLWCFQKTQHWWLHLSQHVTVTGQYSDFITVNFLKDKKVTLQCKEKQLFYCFFSRHAVKTINVWLKWLHIQKQEAGNVKLFEQICTLTIKSMQNPLLVF